jgi:hypothetical protein
LAEGKKSLESATSLRNNEKKKFEEEEKVRMAIEIKYLLSILCPLCRCHFMEAVQEAVTFHKWLCWVPSFELADSHAAFAWERHVAFELCNPLFRWTLNR